MSTQWVYDEDRREHYYWHATDGCYIYQHSGRVYPNQGYDSLSPVLSNIQSGPAEQITEPQALQAGIRAHKIVRETPGEAERLDPRYQKHYPGYAFYKFGKVFKVLCPEPAGNLQAGVTVVTGQYGEPTNAKIRWFVVIREGQGRCTCLPIQTYNGQGVAKPGVIKREHSVVYTGDYSPEIPDWEDPDAQMLKPIPVVPKNPTEHRMDPMARLNYAKPYTVEHNVKSLDFGDVAADSINDLLANFALTLQLALIPAPRSSDYLSKDENTVLTPYREEEGYLHPPPMECQDDNAKPCPPSSGTLEAKNADELHSDSGFYSGSDRSIGIPADKLQDIITVFGDTVIDKTGMHAWAAYAMAERPPSPIQTELRHLLKRFALDLESCFSKSNAQANTKADRNILNESERSRAMGATRIIWKYRSKVAHDLCEKALSGQGLLPAPGTDARAMAHLQQYSNQLSIEERLALSHKPDKHSRDKAMEESAAGDNDGDSEIDDEYDNMADISAVQEYLCSGEPFETLVAAVRRALYCSDETTMRHIDETIRSTLLGESTNSNSVREPSNVTTRNSTKDAQTEGGGAKPLYRANFSVAWDPIQFLESQYGDKGISLASILVLSGLALYSHATTCADYLQQFWPSTSTVLLSQLQTALRKSASFLELRDGGWLFVKLESKSSNQLVSRWLEVEVHATIDLVIEFAQQVSWLAAALREGLSGSPVSRSRCSITPETSQGQGVANFSISVTQQHLNPTENSCWQPLFNGAVIAYGFPIPERGNEPGLEIAVDLMAALTGVRHAVEYEGGVVLKGFSTMLVPTKCAKDIVQWHLICQEDQQHLTYEDGLRQCTHRVLADQLNLEALRTTKMIVGWCSSAQLFFGSKQINYQKMKYSGATGKVSRVRLDSVAFGFQQFGIAHANVKFGAKDGRFHFQRVNGPYDEIISLAEHTRVVLYDSAEKRGWLVPASDVILHIVQARYLKKFGPINKENEFGLFSKDPSERTAQESLSDEPCRVVSKDEDKSYRFKDLVLDVWSLLERLAAEKAIKDCAPGIELKGTLRDELHGFEFQDVIDNVPFQPKRCPIAKTSGGWPDLIRDIGALTFFANGFEDLIRPQKCVKLCHRWQSVPKGNDYLAVTVKVLKDLYEIAGYCDDHRYLTCSQLQWHQGSAVFDECKTPQCHCDRLNQIFGKHSIGTISGPGSLDLYERGAVIFGRSGSLFESLKSPSRSSMPDSHNQKNAPISIPVMPNEREASKSTASGSGSSLHRSNRNDGNLDSSATTAPSDDLLSRHQDLDLEEAPGLRQSNSGIAHGEVAVDASCPPEGPKSLFRKAVSVGKSHLGSMLSLSVLKTSGPSLSVQPKATARRHRFWKHGKANPSGRQDGPG